MKRPKPTREAAADPPVVLFDGLCNLCNGSVQFIIRRDARALIRFASLESPFAKARLAAAFPGKLAPDSIVLIENGQVFTRSSAALRICRRLRFPWPLLYSLVVVPRPLRDAIYGFIAARRYRWFGRTESCPIPTPGQRARFILETSDE